MKLAEKERDALLVRGRQGGKNISGLVVCELSRAVVTALSS